MPGLFDSITVGDLQLPNRIFMALLTRCRAEGGDRVPNDLMVEYYAQRASAGASFSRKRRQSLPWESAIPTHLVSGPRSRLRAGSRSPVRFMPAGGISFSNSGTWGGSPIRTT